MKEGGIMRLTGYRPAIDVMSQFNKNNLANDKNDKSDKSVQKKKEERINSADVERMKQIIEARKKSAERAKNDTVAKKIARGQYVSAKERKKLYEENPEKFRKAVIANQVREATSKRLMQAKTKLEKSTIIAEGKSMGLMIAEKGDLDFAELYVEAIRKAELDDQKGKKFTRTSSKNAEAELILTSKQPTIDVKG